ncbi:MAG: hypothetical protein WC865_02190 [Bacteroidales bacterium]
METLKTKILPGFLFLMAALPFLFTSCTKEETDLRDEITGQYSYTVKIYMEDGADLVYVGDQGNVGDITGTMRVTKNSGDPGVLDFYDGNIVMFHGTNVKDAGNAIVFDIPEQEAWIGPGNVQVVGYNYWDVNSSSYHGAFIYEDDSIEIAFTARIMDVGTGLVMILTAFRK